MVNVSKRTRKAALEIGVPVERDFPSEPAGLHTWLRCMRLHQWSKNLLLFVPLLLAQVQRSGRLRAGRGLLRVWLRRLGHLPGQRSQRSQGRSRPSHQATSAGERRSRAMPALSGAGADRRRSIGGAALGLALRWSAGLYLAISLSYSLHLKTVPIFDVFLWQPLHASRPHGPVLIAGNSPWLLVFTMFSFFSLSMAKRHLEIVRAPGTAGPAARPRLRGERCAPDLVLRRLVQPCAILILFFYVTNDAYSTNLYPILLAVADRGLGLSLVARIWLLTHRGELNDDPVLFAVRDPLS